MAGWRRPRTMSQVGIRRSLPAPDDAGSAQNRNGCKQRWHCEQSCLVRTRWAALIPWGMQLQADNRCSRPSWSGSWRRHTSPFYTAAPMGSLACKSGQVCNQCIPWPGLCVGTCRQGTACRTLGAATLRTNQPGTKLDACPAEVSRILPACPRSPPRIYLRLCSETCQHCMASERLLPVHNNSPLCK